MEDNDIVKYNNYGNFIIPELLLSRCINHENIVRANKIYRKNNQVYLKYPNTGVNLQNLIENDELTNKQKLKIIYEIGRAIAMLHSRGLCHRQIRIENVLCEYEELYYHPKILTKATRGNKEHFISDVEDFKAFILETLCPNIEESYKLSKNDLSIILPYVTPRFKDFIARICNYDNIYEILSSSEFDDIKTISGEKLIDYSYVHVDRNRNYDGKYREGVKEIYCLFKESFKSRYLDELFLSIDLYNRAYDLVKKGMDIKCYYASCILIGTKTFENPTLSIDDIRDGIHSLFNVHPKREDMLSAELDILVYLKGVIYTPWIFDECKNVKELYAILIFYILDKELYNTYHELYMKLKNKHSKEISREDTYITCEEFMKLENSISDDEMDRLEKLLD